MIGGTVKHGGRFGKVGRPQHDVQNTGHGAVKHGFVQCAAAHSLHQLAVVHPLRAGHFQLQPGRHALDAVVHRAPVGHDEAFETPRIAQDVGQQRAVFAGVVAVDPVVAAHDRPRLGLLDGGLERGQVDFVQGALVDAAVHRKAARLLIVGGKVLDACADALALHAADEPCGQLPGQIGVFGIIFKIAAAQRAALDIDGGSQQHLHTLGACFAPQRRAHAAGQRRVKRGRRRAPCREANRADAVVGVGAALFLGAQAVGAVADLDGRDAEPRNCLGMPEILAGAQPGLFLQCQRSHKLLHSSVHRDSPFIIACAVFHIIARQKWKKK